jgi:hypothetical protein
MLPSHGLLARVFYRVPVSICPLVQTKAQGHETLHTRGISTSPHHLKWEGRPASENTVREKDSHNVQQDAVREGKADRQAKEEGGSRAASERAGKSHEKARAEFPEAPDTIGMQDERGGVSY